MPALIRGRAQGSGRRIATPSEGYSHQIWSKQVCRVTDPHAYTNASTRLSYWRFS